ncbi:MAG: epoxyqueuosine reductase [Ruminococcaceae bacterium]|nr:epoxyqueuosine reductase [Oscillospiraceae bacterium]
MNAQIKEFLSQHMVSEVGFAACPDSPFENLENAVSLVFRLSDAVVDQIGDAPTHTYFHHYRTMNAYIDSVSLRLVLFLQERGYRAAAVPASQSTTGLAGIFSHKTAAVRAGLGFIGKSGLFLSGQFGPRVRLGTVFTDAPIKTACFPQKSECGACDLCSRACGAMAIRNVNYCEGMTRDDILDARACSAYMKEKFRHIGRGAVCGVCMQICPRGKSKPES